MEFLTHILTTHQKILLQFAHRSIVTTTIEAIKPTSLNSLELKSTLPHEQLTSAY